VDHVEGVLRSHGYTGRGEHINVRPSAVPKRIPLKGAKNPPALRIKLTALDHTLLDDATQKIVRIIKEKSRRAPVAYPLPVQKPETKEESQLRHRRVVAIWDVPPSLIQQLTAIQLPSGIDVTIQQAKRRSN
jgi:ribosomal protein S10